MSPRSDISSGVRKNVDGKMYVASVGYGVVWKMRHTVSSPKTMSRAAGSSASSS